jgi:hypothetical protein
MKVKNLSVTAAGAMFSAFALGMQAAHAHAGHSHSEPLSGLLPPISSSADSVLNSGSIFYGEPLPVGNGTFNSFVRLDDNGNPSDIGVTFSNATLSGLPNLSNSPSTFPFPTQFLYPPLPSEASATPFGDLELLYFNDGHTPEEVPGYRDEHIDFSFYLPTFQERRSTICPNSPGNFQCAGEELERAVQRPAPGAIPTGFEQVPPGSQFYALAGAGTAFFDTTGSYPLEAAPFFGFSEGEMTFIDLLITNNFFQALNAQPNGGTFTTALAQPAGFLYAKDGYYPTTYSVTANGSGEYTVSLGGLTFRPTTPTSVPEHSSTLALLAIGALGVVAQLRINRRKTGVS